MEDAERGATDAGLLLRIDASPVGGARQTRPVWHVMARVLFYVGMWCATAPLIIMLIATTQAKGGIFPYSFALTVCVQMCTGALAWVLAKLVHRAEPPPLKPHEWKRIIGIGLIQGVEIGLTNKVLQFLTVSSRTMINSTGILFMMLTAWLWGLERLGLRRMLSCTFLIGGGLLQGLEKHSEAGTDQMLGVAMQVASMLMSSQRWVLVQLTVEPPPDSALKQMGRLQLMARTMPITGLVCMPLALGFEPDAFQAAPEVALLGRTFLIAASLLGMTFAEWQLVKLLQSAVAFNILAQIHQFPIILVGIFFQHDHVGTLSIFGYGLCLIGAFLYRWASKADH